MGDALLTPDNMGRQREAAWTMLSAALTIDQTDLKAVVVDLHSGSSGSSSPTPYYGSP